MDYNEAMDYINNTAKFGMNLGLLRINKLLEYMGNPQKKLKCIHIAGTNGKGSITSIVSRILIEDGLRVGIYTSPYLQRFTERIKINDEEIPTDDIARLITYIKPIVDKIICEGLEHPTEFEIITALMFKYFDEKSIDYAVIEVGLGGRLDSTNVINPLVSIISSISFDHMGVLGDTLAKIAYEKAGIIKENGVVVIYPQEKEVYNVIRDVCCEKNAKLIKVVASGINLKSYSPDEQIFDLEYDDETYENLHMKLLGEYQLVNAKTALAAIKELSMMDIKIKRDSIYKGINNVRWPGRLEVISKKPTILLDGAHNIQGIQSLKQAIKKYFKYNKLVLVMGVLKDKQVIEMCETIMPMVDIIITTTPDSDRALSSKELGEISATYCKDVIVSYSINDAYIKAMDMIGNGDLLIFCGSLYMIGHIRTLIEESKK